MSHVMCIAGELSGDLLGSLLVKGMQSHIADLHLSGVAGPQMLACGMQSEFPMEILSVNGYVDVLKNYASLKKAFDQLADKALSERPDLVIGVDSPGFNLRFEKKMKAAGLRTVHFISPSVWAWRRGRIKKIVHAAEQLLCVFPFEPALYEGSGVTAHYVGHPLADMIDIEPDQRLARTELGIGFDEQVLAILPGSRRAEIELITPRFMAAAKLLQHCRPNLRMIVPVASPRFRNAIIEQVPADIRVDLVNANSHTVLAAADAVLVASGTASLEAMLFKKPMVVGYVTAWLNYQLVKRMLYLPWVGLPNILAGETIVPELLQQACTPQALCDAVLFQLEDEKNRAQLINRFTALHYDLKRDTAQTAGRIIAGLL